MKVAARILFAIALVISGCGGDDSSKCSSKEDCGANEKCENSRCVELCSCNPADECTATAAECQSGDVVDSEVDVVNQCTVCSFASQCNDENTCTKDDCVDGCCVNRVFSVEEAVGCCKTLADCRDLDNPYATDENPDGDFCTVDYCEDFHCKFVMEDPTCCRKDSDCTDENFCTTDKCEDNVCTFSEPNPACCNRDSECADDNPCTMDICIAGICAHPKDNLTAGCTCSGNLDCNDNNDCTTDSCQDNRCVYGKGNLPYCCSNNEQCDDSDSTTIDYCKLYACVHEKMKTCLTDSTCDDGNACTADVCQDGYCVHNHTEDPYCCNVGSDCMDNNDCTEGECVENMCQYHILEKEGCCRIPQECDDGIGCTIDECVNWACDHTPVGAKCCTEATADLVCNDGNPCTVDACVDGLCNWQQIPGGCCDFDDDCKDCIDVVTGETCPTDHTTTPPSCVGVNCVDNICTIHNCNAEYCYFTPVPGCCLSDKDCADSNPCTLDACTGDNICINQLEEGCCANAGMCNDGDICTTDICTIPEGTNKGTCDYEIRPDCCKTPDDCPPKPCANTYCQNGNCIYPPKDNCCIHDQECDDGNVCTIDKCTETVCEHLPVSAGTPGCD